MARPLKGLKPLRWLALFFFIWGALPAAAGPLEHPEVVILNSYHQGESTRLISAAAPVPVFAMHETRLGHGIVGGMLLGGREHGEKAAELALRVLGQEGFPIPVVTKSTATPMFDCRQLDRFGISLESLPEASVLIHRPESFYARNKLWLAGITAGTAFFFMVIFILITNIMRRRHAEKALLAGEASLRSIFNSTGDAMIILDTNRVVTSVNPAFSQLFGYTPEEINGRCAAQMHLSDEHFRKFGEKIFPDLTQQGYWRGEWQFRKKDGSPVATEMIIAYLHLPDGTFSGYVGAHRDITRRQEAEEALRRSEARFRNLFATMAEGVALHTMIYDEAGKAADYRILSVNPAFEKHTGLAAAQIQGQLASKAYDEDMAPYLKIYDRVVRTGEPQVFETFFPPLGRYFQISATSPQPGQFVTVFEDITARKRMEQALRDSEKKYRLLFENAPLGIMHYDEEGTITDLNSKYAEIVGAEKARLIGVNLRRQVRDERMRQALETSLGGGIGYYEGEYLSVAGGKKTPVRAFFQSTFSETGAFSGGVSIFEDYTEKFLAHQNQREYLIFLQTLMDALPNPVFYKDINGLYLGCNKACEEAWGWSKEELMGMSVFDLHPRDLAETYHAKDLELLAHPGVQVYEGSVAHAGGGRRETIIHKATFTNWEGTLAGIIGVEVDITARKRTEREMKSLAKFPEENPHTVLRVDGDGIILYANHAGKAFLDLWDCQVGQTLPGDWGSQALESFHSAASQELEVSCRDRVFLLTLAPIVDMGYLNIYGVDITRRKWAEEQILLSLKEKEVLLKEVHHRVKNNMQIISTLLAIQAKYDKEKKPAEVFQDCQNRIRSMALIHESLYRADNLDRINFRRYLEKLAGRLLASYGSSSQDIRTRVDGGDLHLDISQAVPCGLIANELIVNSLKHAFKGRREGEIQVTIDGDDGQRVLEFRDNGQGLRPDLDLEHPSSFGLMMVRNLTKQLGGVCSFQSNGGTSCKIVF